jgi:hypothetical protein
VYDLLELVLLLSAGRASAAEPDESFRAGAAAGSDTNPLSCAVESRQ